MSNSNERIRLGAGGGGQQQRELIEQIRQRFTNPLLDPLEDGAVLGQLANAGEDVVFTTDSFVVNPLRFPGGDLGKLAVCGTVNDLAVMGAQPRYLSCGMIVEEGMLRDDFLGLVDSMASAANEANVQIVTGDSKVVERGKGDGVFINTAGIGVRPAGRNLGIHRIGPGQALVVNGTLGDHSIAVMLSREGMDFETDATSDCAPLNSLVELMFDAVGSENIFAMRDLTRGGLAAVLNEYAEGSSCDMEVDGQALQIRQAVRAAARVLGFDPAVLANEGKLAAVVSSNCADALVETMKGHKYGQDAVVIGQVGTRFDPTNPAPDRPRRPLVLFTTPGGGKRVVDMPFGELLPRIC